MSRVHIAKHEVGHKPEGDPTELYQRAGRKGSQTTHYVPLQTERRTKSAGIRPKLSKEQAQANKILDILAGMADAGPRRSAGIRSIAGKLFSYVAHGERRAVDDAELRGGLDRHSHSFKADIEETIAVARQEARSFLPTPREIGDATEYGNQEWDDDGCPAFVWPTDIRSDVEIAAILEVRRKAADAKRKREDRERNGARPHAYSKAALARFYGVHVETIGAMLEDGRLHPHTGDRIDPATGEVIRCFRPEPKEALSRKRTKTTVGISAAPTGAPANTVPAGFTEADLAALAAAVDIGLRDAGNAVELPDRKAALARLMEVAAETFAPKRASNDRVSAPVRSTDDAAGETGEAFGKPERGSPSAGPTEPDQAKPIEDIEMTATPAYTTDTTEPAPQRAPVRSRRDWGVAIWKVNRQLVEPGLDDADRIVLDEERAELVAGFRAAFPAPEQAVHPGSASGKADRPAAASGRPGAATACARPTRKARA